MFFRSRGEKIADAIIVALMLLIVFISLYPVWYVLIASLSSPDAINEGRVYFWIDGFNLAAYEEVFGTKNLLTSYGNTFYYSGVGTVINMILTLAAAYTLSKKRLHFRGFIATLFLITMWFNAGMMPTYLNIRNLRLLDTRTGILLFEAFSTYYIILARTYFESIPQELEEAAKIDGASDIYTFLKVFMPLSTTMAITLTLYYFVGHWNAYFWSMILLKTPEKIPLQVLLRKLVVEMNANFSEASSVDYTATSRETTIYSTIVISIVPMMIIYPFAQKYFVKGVMVGSVKG